MFGDGPIPIERVRVGKSSLTPKPSRGPIPAQVSRMAIDIKFPANHEATLARLAQTLSAVNLQVGFKWSGKDKGEEILNRKLPFLGFQGSVGELVSTLRTGLGVVSWYENGILFISDQEEYSIALPQNKDLLEAVAGEITSLGGGNVVKSIRGGKILYTASPTVQDELIGPYLKRMARNLAVVNLQIAVVSLALTDNTTVGFDWNSFQAAFDSTTKTMGTLTGATTGTGTGTGTGTNNGSNGSNSGNNSNSNSNNGSNSGVGTGIGTGIGGVGIGTGTGTGTTTQEKQLGKLLSATGSGIAFSQTSLGTVAGAYGALTIAGAINFLSNFGNTDINQNVSLRTLSGSEVAFRSGQEVPYVKGVSNTSTGGYSNNGSSGVMGSTQTDKVQTGLTLKTTPHFDADAELVTLDVNLELKSILQFVELKAGDQIGSITQPMTQDQSLTDIVRIQAGKTVVIGGLQYDSETKSNTEPAFLREEGEKSGMSFGQRGNQVQRNALFIIIRPSVTVYEPMD
jgi:type II secretory pathway component GspD/PulD (secretin)